MSFLLDTTFPGSTQLHVDGLATNKHGERRPRKSQSHASLLAPLIQLVRDPVGTISGAVGALEKIPETPSLQDGEIDRKQLLYLHMRNAESYEEWKAAANELDILEGNDAWKLENESHEYDSVLVAARLQQLDEARLSCDVTKMLFLVRTALTRGLGGMGDLRLYKHSHIGTKALIERYIESAQKTLMALLEVSARQADKCPIEPRILVEQLLLARQSFGRSALLLSGGGTFGMNHIGVVKTLWKNRLLPRIISGASAGSIVCAVLCSRTDSEIPEVLEEFCYGDLAVFEKEGEEDSVLVKATRFLKYGALFDISHLTNVMRNLLGDITFQESYNRTRRILNITVSSASLYELPRLLNYVTAPNVMIWSAVCASCSVPFVFSAASLLAKDPKTGKEIPWNPTPNAGWIDGSVDNDLPMTRLAEMFNVNHFIVSQVNPHVVPFLAKEDEIVGAEAQQAPAVSAGPSWIHSMANLAKGEALHRLQVLAEMGIFPNYITKVRSVLNQRYSGDITIFPSISFAHFPKVLSNPTSDYMLQSMLTGERATWPKLSQIQNHVAIELALDETIQQLRARVVFSPSQIDLRLSNFSRPLSQGNGKPVHKSTRFQADPPSPLRSSALFRSNAASQPRLKLPPAQIGKPYLPAHPLRKHRKSFGDVRPQYSTTDAFSSSTNLGDGSSTDGDDEGFSADTETSDILSSPSPPSSPSSAMPALWPSTRQLFPSASQPATPSISSSLLGHRHISLLNLTMTTDPKRPSSPELRYKRLFHPSPATNSSNPAAIDSEVQREVEKTTQTSSETIPTLRKTECLPESQIVPPPPAALFHPGSFSSALPTVIGSPAILAEASPNPSLSKEDKTFHALSSKNLCRAESQDFNIGQRERRYSRRGSAQGLGLNLLLDISGTRGMMLRRKKSSRNMFGQDADVP
ncbi:acyl transferase/acyl hydrolase/lysophospholipase [Dendryphion nanum]|uniref:Acyl transferase/acyl hydrolase/lysophospholipase n=1 Tax=Dendryphion nanum TaxID=256645 RepID=A0A9P9DUI5_9PLEO|nr:acyl transferase/acyl hydrolase/lysophospholipase [Dendryphion nanum]